MDIKSRFKSLGILEFGNYSSGEFAYKTPHIVVDVETGVMYAISNTGVFTALVNESGLPLLYGGKIDD